MFWWSPSLFSIKLESCCPALLYVEDFILHFRSDQLLSRVRLFATPWIAALQASLSITNSRSSPRLMSIESVMPSSHLILCRPLLLLPPIPPSIRVFSNESTLLMRWPKYWSFSFSIIPSKEMTGWISLQSKGLSRVFSNTTVQNHYTNLPNTPLVMRCSIRAKKLMNSFLGIPLVFHLIVRLW